MKYSYDNQSGRVKALPSASGGTLTIHPGDKGVVDCGRELAQGMIDAQGHLGFFIALAGVSAPTMPASVTMPGPAKHSGSRAELFHALVALLEPEKHFTQSGTPDVNRLNERLPEGAEPFTAAERNALWESK